MALYAFDGTGNEDHDDKTEDVKDTNVADFFEGYVDPNKNDDASKKLGSLYLKGIGTRAHLKVISLVAEAFGAGGHPRINDALRRLKNNLEAGDNTVDIIGFSRGAALAIAFANEIAKKVPNVSIRFLGVWDIVAEFGAPGQFVNLGFNLHLPRNAKAIYHAMALDESRALFQLTRLQEKDKAHGPPLTEVWFRGVHSDVGGGNQNVGLNWISLHWMYENAVRAGLPIDPAAIAQNLTDKEKPQALSRHKLDAKVERHIRTTDLLHASVQKVPGALFPEFAMARIDDMGIISSVESLVKNA